ncbi:MAG: NAD-dependent epimerase/dehydratase family protein [Candidatus Diapherotrites archaeon]|nr:NAD-dependent epimerase/dehydratase family protein [Candidatus Diapherotrites archaeon]
MANVLVTGGAGFIGSHVAEELIKAKHKVVVLDDLSSGFESNVPKDAVFIKGSIEDYSFLENLFNEYSFEYVFHLAAYAAEGLSHFIRRFNYRNNLCGSINLINLSILNKVKCFVFTSSIAVYGKNQLPMTEDTVPSPEDPYGISKYVVELDLHAAHEMFGLNYIIFRPHNVYGERQNIGDMYRNVIGIFMNQIMQKKPLTIFGDGTQTRAFSYIGDVAPVIARSIQVPAAYNDFFNVGADKPYSVNLLIKLISKEFNVAPQVSFEPERNEVKHAYSTHEKVERVFKNKAQYTIEEGIHYMAQWAKKEGPKINSKFSNIEITEKLPPIWK